MIRNPFVLLLLVVLLTSCRTSHDAAYNGDYMKTLRICRDVDRFLAYYERTYRFLYYRHGPTDVMPAYMMKNLLTADWPIYEKPNPPISVWMANLTLTIPMLITNLYADDCVIDDNHDRYGPADIVGRLDNEKYRFEIPQITVK